jgi:hypothetical protein
VAVVTFTAVAAVGETLLDLFRARIERQRPASFSRSDVALTSPEAVDADSGIRLGLFPYRVARDGTVGATAPEVTRSTKRDPPLPLSLRYLLTAYPDDGDGDRTTKTLAQQRTLGLAIQLLHDNSRLEPEACAAGLEQERPLSITVTSEPVDRLTNLWTRFGDATYHPSVTFEVSPVLIRSTNEESVTRVDERETDLSRRSNGPDVP